MNCPSCGAASAVLETRNEADGVFLKRRRECSACSKRFNTFEVSDALEATLKRYLKPHVVATKKQWAAARRNAEIVRRVLEGEKRYVLAGEFGLSDSMLTTITRRAGLPAYSRVNPHALRAAQQDTVAKENR